MKVINGCDVVIKKKNNDISRVTVEIIEMIMVIGTRVMVISMVLYQSDCFGLS